jgi:hypothetical protein
MSDLVNKDYLWGVNVDVNGKVFKSEDVINKEKPLKEKCDNYEEILDNINILKNDTDAFLQRILDDNPSLNSKDKKDNLDEEIVG